MGLFAPPRHPENITRAHHVYPLPPQDHNSHQPSLATAQIPRGLRLGNMQAVFADKTNMDKWGACSFQSFFVPLLIAANVQLQTIDRELIAVGK